MGVLSVLLLVPLCASPCVFVRGDVNCDGVAGIADVVALRRFLHHVDGAELRIPDAADVNDDGVVDWEDLVALRRGLLRKPEPSIPPPFPIPGVDPTADSLPEPSPCEIEGRDIPVVGRHYRRPDPGGGSDLQFIHFARRELFVAPGSTIAIPVVLTSYRPVGAFSVAISYDPALVTHASFKPGRALQALGPENLWIYEGSDRLSIAAVLPPERTWRTWPPRHILGSVALQIRPDVLPGTYGESVRFEDLPVPGTTRILWLDNEISDTLGRRFVLDDRYGPVQLTIGAGVPFVRGDVDGDGRIGVEDVYFLLSSLFGDSSELPCPDAADIDDDGRLTVADPIRLLGYLFGPAQLLPDPFPNPGIDETPDGLGPCDGRPLGLTGDIDERW